MGIRKSEFVTKTQFLVHEISILFFTSNPISLLIKRLLVRGLALYVKNSRRKTKLVNLLLVCPQSNFKNKIYYKVLKEKQRCLHLCLSITTVNL